MDQRTMNDESDVEMAVYLTLAAVAARLADDLKDAERLQGLRVQSASEFKFHALYSQEELTAFNAPNGPSVFLIAKDPIAFETLIPERQNGVCNYLRLKNTKALERINAVLAAAA